MSGMITKHKAAGLALLLALGLAACSEADAGEETYYLEDNYVLRTVVDRDTGCKYIFARTQGAQGFTPLLNAQGEPDCGLNE